MYFLIARKDTNTGPHYYFWTKEFPHWSLSDRDAYEFGSLRGARAMMKLAASNVEGGIFFNVYSDVTKRP